MSLNDELSAMFARMSAIMEIRGESPFKAIAFSKVSRILKETSLDVRQCCLEGTLGAIEGIGESSRRIIEEYVKTARSAEYESLLTSVPTGLLPMLQIQGLGPKTIALFWKQRNITSIEELLKAIEEGRLAGLKGVGAKKI
jgi:DNA polymerase (family X)